MSDGTHRTRSQRKAAREVLDNLEAALDHEPTRVVLRWVIDQSGLFEPTRGLDPQTMAFAEGQRSVALEMIAAMNEIDPYHVVRLMKEGADDIVTLRAQANKEWRRQEHDDADA